MKKGYYKQYCKDFENIENYDKALADNFKGWDCHHRLQTHTSDGERRLVNISAAELKALDMYYNRPAEELIFLTESEHYLLHPSMLGKHHSEEAKKKIGKASKKRNTGEKNPMYGKCHSAESRRKMSEAAKRRQFSEEHRNKLNETRKGRRWYNNGKIEKLCYECPDGFLPGRLIL